MNFKQYIILMAASSTLSWMTWIFMLFSIDPESAGLGIFFLFYTSLLIAITSTLSILGLIMRAWAIKQDEIISSIAGRSFRHAALLAFLIIGLLYLQSKSILNWWFIVLFIAALTLLEFFIISYKKKLS